MEATGPDTDALEKDRPERIAADTCDSEAYGHRLHFFPGGLGSAAALHDVDPEIARGAESSRSSTLSPAE